MRRWEEVKTKFAAAKFEEQSKIFKEEEAKEKELIIKEKKEEANKLKKDGKEKKKRKPRAKICDRYVAESRQDLLHFTDIWDLSWKINPENVQLVTQMRWSFDKAVVFRQLLDHWLGPVSIAVYIPPDQYEEFLDVMELFGDVLAEDRILIHLATGENVSYLIISLFVIVC